VLLLLALSGSLLASILVGVAHGTGRALGVVSNMRPVESSCMDMLVLGKEFRWRFIDGLGLLFSAGILMALMIGLVLQLI
jgi:hypothetical protein